MLSVSMDECELACIIYVAFCAMHVEVADPKIDTWSHFPPLFLCVSCRSTIAFPPKYIQRTPHPHRNKAKAERIIISISIHFIIAINLPRLLGNRDESLALAVDSDIVVALVGRERRRRLPQVALCRH